MFIEKELEFNWVRDQKSCNDYHSLSYDNINYSAYWWDSFYRCSYQLPNCIWLRLPHEFNNLSSVMRFCEDLIREKSKKKKKRR